MCVIAIDRQRSEIPGRAWGHRSLVGDIPIDDPCSSEHGVFRHGHPTCGRQGAVLDQSAAVNSGGVVDENIAIGDESAVSLLGKLPGTTIGFPDIMAVPSGTSSSPLVTVSSLTSWSEELSSKVSELITAGAVGVPATTSPATVKSATGGIPTGGSFWRRGPVARMLSMISLQLLPGRRHL